MRTIPLGLATALLLTPLLAGCFSDGSAGKGGARSEQRIRVALAVPPAQALSPYSNDATVLGKLSVVEGLTRLDADGAAKPALAASWTQTNDTTWTFELRDARFQDGTKVTAETVANSLAHASGAKPAPRVLSDIELTAKAKDAHTVVLTTGTVDPVLPLRLASPALGILAPKAYGPNGAVSPIGTGTGPFKITKLSGKTRATLDRFDGYWGGKAKAAGIDVSWIADGTARANALRGGSVDIAEWIPTSQAKLLAPGTLHQVPSTRTDSLLLNTGSGVFRDAAMRAAARQAVEPGALVDSVFGGYADTAQGLFGPAIPWTRGKHVTVEHPVKPATAEQVRRQTGGKAITLATYTNRAELPEVASVLQQQLEKAGFAVKQDVREYSQMEADLLAGRYDALVFSRVTLLDTGDPVAYLASDYTSKGSYNITRLAEPAVDRAISAAAESGAGTRQDKVMAAEAAVLSTGAVVPLVHEKVLQGISTDVEGAILDPRERSLVGLGTRLK